MPPTYEDVEQAIASVPGVANASVGAIAGTGRGRLRIGLQPGQDAEVVSRAISEMLRDRFGIEVDPATIRPRAPDAEDAPRQGASPSDAAPTDLPDDDADEGGDEAGPQEPVKEVAAASANGWRCARPVIRDLGVEGAGLEIVAEAVLELDGRELRGRATGAATRKATLRAIARATLDAVELLAPGRLKTELEGIELVSDGDDERVTVTVTFLTTDGADKLIGVSVVRGDPEQAIMRATLDAVNRRVGLLLGEDLTG